MTTEYDSATKNPNQRYSTLAWNGLWKNNPALVQLLGLCPLLAVSNNTVNALGLGIATFFVLVLSSTCVSLIRHLVADSIRLPVFVIIIAAAVTAAELTMQAWSYELYQVLGIFLPLITTNCVILGRADAFAAKNTVITSVFDGAFMGLGFALVLVFLGMARELVGTGSLFANMDLLFGAPAAAWHITVSDSYPPLLVAVLPPGAFMITGLLIALKNSIDARYRRPAATQTIEAGSKRVRVTGQIAP
jgi:electron transport complex protein RnfE